MTRAIPEWAEKYLKLTQNWRDAGHKISPFAVQATIVFMRTELTTREAEVNQRWENDPMTKEHHAQIVQSALTTREAEVSRRLIPFLEGYREGVIEDYSTTKEVKLAKLQVLKDVMEILPTNPNHYHEAPTKE